MDVSLKTPFTMLIAAPSQAGKTVFTFRLLQHADTLITPPVDRIIYCYAEYQQVFEQYPDITFHEGIPNLQEFDGKQSVLLVLDDFMSETTQDFSNLFTKFSHHRNISVIYITQNLFYNGKHNRTISLNSHYIVVFKNPRDQTQISVLAKQMFPGNSKYMIEAFNDAVKRDYGYLMIDLKPTTDSSLRLRTNILPGEEPQIAYVQK